LHPGASSFLAARVLGDLVPDPEPGSPAALVPGQ
jgi:hypothetical protein